MDKEILFGIAKILDNEYIGKEDVFDVTRHLSCWHLKTTKCDMTSFIKVWERNNKISSIEILSPDSEGWRPITTNSWTRIENYLNSLAVKQ